MLKRVSSITQRWVIITNNHLWHYKYSSKFILLSVIKSLNLNRVLTSFWEYNHADHLLGLSLKLTIIYEHNIYKRPPICNNMSIKKIFRIPTYMLCEALKREIRFLFPSSRNKLSKLVLFKLIFLFFETKHFWNKC